MNVDFVIRNPLGVRILGWVMTAVGLIVMAVITPLYFTVSVEYTLFVPLETAGASLAGAGLLCGYIGIMEKFELRDGVFSYRKPFKKGQSASIQEIDRVEVCGSKAFFPLLVDVIFFDKDGKKLIHFYDDGTLFRGGKFLNALQELHIPICYT